MGAADEFGDADELEEGLGDVDNVVGIGDRDLDDAVVLMETLFGRHAMRWFEFGVAHLVDIANFDEKEQMPSLSRVPNSSRR